MAVMHIVKQNNFSIVSNAIIRDTNLSLKARGLFILMLSLPDRWEFSVRGLSKIAGEGVDAIRSGLKELEKQGYLLRERERKADGRLGDMEYTLYEEPQKPAQEETKEEPQKPAQEETKQEVPTESEPIQENPMQEEPRQINKEYNKVLTKERTERENSAREQAVFRAQVNKICNEAAADLQKRYFTEFWNDYPRHVNKPLAMIAWRNLPVDTVLYSKILDAVERYKNTRQWQDKSYIPYPATFLQDERWEDDIPDDVTTPPQAKKKNDVMAAAEAMIAAFESE